MLRAPCSVLAEPTVNLVDIMPTVLSLLGIAQPQRVEGTDLRECLEGKPGGSRR